MVHVLPKRNVPAGRTRKLISNVSRVQFCPFEDVLGISHDTGFTSILIPGAGEPNFDSKEANPYQTKTQRRETTVMRLLEKLPADIITLNPDDIGTVVDFPEQKQKEHNEAEFDANFPGKEWEPKYKARGRSSSSIVHAKKKKSVMDKKENQFEEERIQREYDQKIQKQKEKELPPAPVNALQRFQKK